MSLMKFISDVGKFLSSPAGQVTVRVAAKTGPRVARSIDHWYSSYTYEQAKKELKKQKYQDTVKLTEIYQQRKHDMSEGVQQAFRERLGI